MGKRLDAFFEELASGKSDGVASAAPAYGPKTTAFLESLAENASAGQFPKNAFADTLPQGVAGPVRNDRIMPAYRQSQSREENYGPAGGNIDTSKDYLPLDSEWSTRDQYTVGVNDRKYTILDEGGKSIIIPMVDASRMSPQLTDREAVELYHKTGKNYGTFDSYDAARAYLDVLKAKDRARQYDAGTLTDRDAIFVEKDKRALERKEREMRKSYGDADSNFIKALQLAAQSGLGTTNAGLSNISELYRNNKNMQQSDKAISTVSAEERQQIGDKSAVLGTAYDLWQNFAMNAPAMAAGAATGAPIVGSAVIFASSFGNDLKYAEEGGHDPGRAYAYAFLDGLNQALLDYVGSIPGISKIGETLTKNIKNPVLKFLGNMGEEALTEDAQSVLENGLKSIILGEMNDASPFSEEAMYSALLGALSAGLLNGPQVALEAKRTVKVGKEFLNSPGGITNLWVLGLSNPKSSEEYQTTVKLKEKMEKTGKTPSAYQVGALVLQCQSETAMAAREIDTAVRESAANTGVAAETAEAVAAVSTRFSKKVGFVPTDAAILQTGNGAAAGAYDSETDTVFINAAIETDTAVQFVLKHELTHSIEGTSMWNSLRRVIHREMGDAAFSAAVERVQNNRAAVGEQLDTAGAEKEVIANWVGDNLFKDGFADAVTKEDSKLGSLFAGTFLRLRYAMSAIKNGKQAARMQYAENLFRKALDKTPAQFDMDAEAEDDERDVRHGFNAEMQSEITKEYQAAVDKVLNMKNTNPENLLIGYTPSLLQEMGMPSVPFVIGTGHVYSAAKTEMQAKKDHNFRKGVHYHGLGDTAVKNIYDSLQDPVMIIAAKDVNLNSSPLRSTHSVVAIVDVGKPGSSLLLPIEITAERTVAGVQMDVNVLSSVYEKNVQGLVREAIAAENSGDVGIYYAKKEAIDLIPAGVQFPIRIQEMMTSNSIIRRFDEKVNMKISDTTQSMQFKRWFGDWQNHPEEASKVVNEDGTPKVVYHGTDADFNVFDSESGVYWFSESQDYAEAMMEERGGGHVTGAYLALKNPLYAKLPPDQFSNPTYEAPLIRKAKAEGYDGLVIETDTDIGDVSHEVFFAAFSPEQIKSATENVGTFDRNNPDIRRAVAGESETDIALRESAAQQENATQKENTQKSTAQEDTAQRTETPERAGANAYSNAYYTATRTEDAVEAMLDEAERAASFDSEEELSPLEEVAQETQRRKVEKRTKFQEKQAAERADLVRRFKNGTLSEAEYDAALAKLTDEAVADNDKKWEKGARGRAVVKEVLGADYQYARDTYVKPLEEKILQEQRAKRQAAEEKRTRKAAEIDLEKKLNEAEARVLHPKKGRRIPARHAETMLKLLRTISVAVEDKQRYIADRREKLGDDVYPGKQSRYENEIKKAMESGRALSKQFDEMLLLYKDLAKDDGLKSAYAPELDATLSDFTERIRNKSISDMTTEDLTYGAALVGAVMHCEEYAQTFPAEVFGEECTVAEMMPLLLQELRENASELPRALKNFKTLWSDPIAVCNMLGGYHKDSKWVKLGKYLVEESTYREMEVVAAYNNLFLESAQDEKLMKGLRFNNKNRVDGINLVDKEGNDVSITRGMALALYMQLGCESNRNEIMVGKLRIPDVDAYYKSGSRQAYVDGKTVTVKGSTAERLQTLYTDLQETTKRKAELQEQVFALQSETAADVQAEMRSDMRADAIGAKDTAAGTEVAYGKTLRERKDAIWDRAAYQDRRAVRDAYYELQEATTTELRLKKEYAAVLREGTQKWEAVRQKIAEQMTPAEKKFVEKVAQWFNTYQKKFINKPFMHLYGIPRAYVKNYFPRHRMPELVHHDVESIRMDRSLENLGMLKERSKDVPLPIMLTDITNEMQEALEATAQFYGYEETSKTLAKVIGFVAQKEKDSTQLAFGEKYGKSKFPTGVSVGEYFDNLLADMNGARKGSDSGFDKVLGVVRNNVVRAAIAANPRVFASQFSSIMQIPSVIGQKHFSTGVAKALALGGKGKEAREAQNNLMRKYSAAWASRSFGNIAGMEEIADARQGNSAISRAYRAVDDATHGWLLNLTGKADTLATGAVIWFGCEEEIKETRPDLKVGSEEYYRAVGKLHDKVIFETQPDNHIMNRSELQRQTGSLIKLITLFKSQPLKILNQLVTAYSEMRVSQKDFNDGTHGVTAADVKQKKEKFAKVAAYSVVMSTVAFVALRAITNALFHNMNGYRDDDGEITAGSMAEAMGLEALSQIADLVPFGGQVYEVVAARVLGEKYYGLDDNALEAIGNILNDIATSDFTSVASYNRLFQDLSSALGIPYKNISSTVKGILYHAEDIKNGEFLSFRAGSGVGMTQTYRQLYKAMASGKTEKAQSLREYLLSSGKTASEIESGIRAAIRSDNTDAKKQAERAIEEAMTNMYFDSFTEKEQKRVESSLRSFYADKVFSKAGGDMTAANEKAEKAVEKGVSAADYFVARVLKNAQFADKNGDGKVNKAEYRALVDDMECTERVKQILKNMK